MKRILVVLLMLFFGVTLVACSDKDARKDIGDIKDSVEDLLDTSKDHADKLEDHDKAIEDLLEEIADLKDSLKELENKVGNLEDEIDDINGLIENYDDGVFVLLQLNHLLEEVIELELSEKENHTFELPTFGSLIDVVWELPEDISNAEIKDGNLIVQPTTTTGKGEESSFVLKYTLTAKDTEFSIVRGYDVTIKDFESGKVFSRTNVEGFFEWQQYLTNANYKDMLREVEGVIAGKGSYLDETGKVQEFYKLVDVEKETENYYLRLVTEEELNEGDLVRVIGNTTIDTLSQYFTPKLRVVTLVLDDSKDYSLTVLDKGVEFTEFKVDTNVFDLFDLIDDSNNINRSGMTLTLTGRLYVDTHERFKEGGKDGDDLYDTDLVFMDFGGRRVEFYGLSEDQYDELEKINNSYVRIPVNYVSYEILFGAKLHRVQLTNDDFDNIEVLDIEEVKDAYKTMFENKLLNEDIVLSEDVSIDLPVGFYDGGFDADMEVLNVTWSFTGSDNGSATQGSGVTILARSEEATTKVKAVVKLLDVYSEEEKFVTFEVERDFVTKSNEISHTEVELVDYFIDTKDGIINFFEGMLLDENDPYWDEWTYAGGNPDRRSNQDDANKTVDGDRDRLFHIEVEATKFAPGNSDPVTFEYKFDDKYDFTRIVVDAGITGGDKQKEFEVEAYNYETEEWVLVSGAKTNPNQTWDQAYFDIDFSTDLLRVSIVKGTHNNWGCCYHVYIAELIFYGDKVEG